MKLAHAKTALRVVVVAAAGLTAPVVSSVAAVAVAEEAVDTAMTAATTAVVVEEAVVDAATSAVAKICSQVFQHRTPALNGGCLFFVGLRLADCTTPPDRVG